MFLIYTLRISQFLWRNSYLELLCLLLTMPNLTNLARAIAARSYPVLIQGETSTGKTSLISYLANASANHLVRINNHEHTDLQEYIGSYIPKSDGSLVFSHGALVKVSFQTV